MKTTIQTLLKKLLLMAGGHPGKLFATTLLLLLLAGFTAEASTDYGPAVYRPMSGCTKWYTSGSGHRLAVIHDMEGYFASTISYLNRCDIQVSIHFEVNGKQDTGTDYAPGAISQSVRTAYYAWHAVCLNTRSYGTEHEGFASNPAWYTEGMYQSSAALQSFLAGVGGFAKDRNHVVAHGEWQNGAWVNWCIANLGFDPRCNSHTDPGPYWNWTHFMALVNGGGGPATINPPYVFDSDAQGWTAGNSVSPLAYSNTGWPGIIYNDQTGNDAYNFGPPASFGGNGDECVNVSFYPQSGNTANHDMQVFWKTDQDNSWTASKSSPIVSYSAQNAWTVMAFDVNSANWVGKTINQFRLDFDNNNSGTRWIVNHLLKQPNPNTFFNSTTEGWGAGNAVTAPVWTGGSWPGIMYVDQTGNDGYVIKGVSPAYRGARNDRIEVRVYPQNGSTVNHDMQIFWATAAENSFTAAKSSPIAYYSAKDSWITLFFDVGANAAWSGNTGQDITQLRLDFDQANHGNRWIVDYIRVVHDTNPQANTIDNAAIVSVTAPATVNVGATFSATVVMNNSGSKVWSSDATPHRLGSQSPQENTVWGLTRANLPTSPINPGQNVTFTINATAPATPGTYSFDWKMVEDGVQWFGPIAQATINVVSLGPIAPSGLTASAAAYNQVNVAWADNSSNETGFKVERSTDNVNFTSIATLGANVTSYADTTVNAATTYYYRAKSYNSGGDSSASNTATVATPNQPPALGTIGGKTGTEGALLTFTASSSNPNQQVTTTTFQDFEGFADNTANDTVMFRRPLNSSTTSPFLDTSTNYTSVRSAFPAGHSGAKVLKAGWGFLAGTSNPWLRFNTFSPVNVPNPTIDLDQVIRFDIYSDKSLKVGVGVRETATTVAYGANGGTTGTIEWVGVPGTTSGTPNPSQTVAANTWTTLSFNIPFEAVTPFTGDGAVTSGIKGVLEELALIPTGGTGAYTVYVDNFAVVAQNTLTYSLDAGAPAGASIHPKTGVFKWTPSAGQSGNYNITVRVTDRLGLTSFETVAVSVISVGNHKPVLAAIGNKSVNEGSALTFTASATDQDAGQLLTYSLDAGNPSGSSINSSTGTFTWTPTEAQGPGSYPITVRVTDNGAPASNTFETITATVNEVNTAPTLAAVADQSVNEGSTFNLTVAGSDTDVPANTLTYSLVVGAPAGMTINTSSGAINWPTSESYGPATYPVSVCVTDNGTPNRSTTNTFNVTVNEVNIAPSLTLNTTLTTVDPITDFETMTVGSYNGTVLFRQPSFSSTTSNFLDSAVANITSVTNTYPGSDSINKVLHAAFSFKTGQVNPWLRLTTFNASALPNPTVNFTQRVRLKIYTDKALGVAMGLRETDTGAVIGQNGGTTGPIEWAGATATGTSPVPTHTVSANTWTTLEFNLPAETITAFPASGNGVLTSTTGKGVLDHLALTPVGGTGVYNVYFDNLEVVTVSTNLIVNNGQTVTFTSSATDPDFPAQTLTFSLDTPPAGATINAATGDFSWTPSASQAPSTNVITVRVTDDGPGNLSATKTATIVVKSVNTAPTLAGLTDDGIATVEVQSGGAIALTITATDEDLPAQTLTFSLPGTPPAGATINSTSGAFSWTPPAGVASTNLITVRVTDNGVPPLYDEKTLTIMVIPTNAPPVMSLSTARMTETVVSFETFTNNTPNEMVMFKKPANSATTTNFIDTALANSTTVVTSFPAGNSAAGAKVLKATWTFKTGTTNYWVRLTTANAAVLPNPTINASARLKVDVYSTKALKVALGIRETGTTAENGANGGTTGTIEFVGASGKQANGCPIPTRTVNATTWTTLEFDLPNEPKQGFTGDGILNAGQQVLEHLALVGAGGTGAYDVYLDNFQVVTTAALPGTVTMKANSTLQFTASATDPDPGSGIDFGLDADAPTTAAIDAVTGAFTWTPGSSGTTNSITVFANDNPVNGASSKTDTKTLTVIVSTDSLAAQSSRVAGGETVVLNWDARPGQAYQVQYTDRSNGSVWHNLGEPIIAENTTGSIAIDNAGSESFFRVIEAGDSAASE